jgi:hypothetical protein
VLHETERLAALASIGGLLLVAGLGLAAWLEQFRPIIFLVFVFMVGIAPSLSAGLVYLGERWSIVPPAGFGVAMIAAKSFLLCFVVTLIALALIAAHLQPQELAPSTPIFIFLACATAAILAWLGNRAKPWNDYSAQLDAYLVVAVAVAVFVFSPFDPAAPQPIGLLAYALATPHFGTWITVGILWTTAGIWLRRREGWAFPHKKRLLESLAILAAGIVILGLYDDGHFVDMGHYMPLVGPALHAVHGGIPMVDTYSQYGFLPWFIYRAAFAVFPPTFGTAAVVNRLINLAYFSVFLLTLFFVSRRRLSAVWFFLPALLVALLWMITPSGMLNMNALPMTLGGRNLVPAAMSLLMVAEPRRPWARWTALVLLMLASLSSVEILAFTFAPWGYCLVLDSVRARSIRLFLREAALACVAVAAAQAAFFGLIYFSTGAVADYGIYFDLFLKFRPVEESGWSLPFVSDYALWLPIGFAYFLVMAAAFYRALRRDAPDSIVERLVPVAAFGLGPFAYFFGRPQEATLPLSCLPFAVVAIGIAESVFINARRFGPVGPALCVVIALSFAFIIADGLEHFMRPFDPSQANATILRRCFTQEGCRLADVPGNISLALHTQPLDPRTKVGYSVGDDTPRIEEAISMLRRFAPNALYVGMLSDRIPMVYADANAAIGTTAFMATGQWFAWSISSPLNDGTSPLITDQVVKRVASTPAGMLIIIPNDRNNWVNLNQAILDRLVQRCRLSLLETDKYLTAFRTENCDG